MTPSATEQIRKRIESFVLGLDEMIRAASLEVVRQGLLGPGALPTPSRRAKGRLALPAVARQKPQRSASVAVRARGRGASAPGSRGKRTKRTGDQLDALVASVHKYIAKHPGQRMEQIAAGMKVPSKELTLPIQKLKGRLKTKGQKRATSYFAK
ncbi:MAG: hypothetical protein JW940_18970 [Polyangiaceae bacterium]|nr:hypothetical protein [Polyangiaceae bacterium]